MSRNSQGLYTLPPGNPVVPNTLIESTWANTTMDDIAVALTGSLPRDGSAPMTGPLILKAGNPSQPREAVSKAYLEQFLAYATGMPVGAVFAFASGSSPAGYLLCNGQAVSRTTYATLFAAIGTTFGSGDGVSTFNVPDMRDWFVRGKGDARPLGSTQAASFATHIHPISDPTHTHGASQTAHDHTITTGSHNHALNDPGHVHGSGFPNNGALTANGSAAPGAWQGLTDVSGTGISIQAVGNLGGSADSRQPAVTVAGAVTGISIGAAGGTETVPQNIALDYYIKATNDAAQVTAVTGIDTSDANMISVDNINPVVPELIIHSNVPFGIPKLDASGKILLSQLPQGASVLLGYFDASQGGNPSQEFPATNYSNGEMYIISVGGTIPARDPVTGVESQTLVAVGGSLLYLEGQSQPDGWYYSIPVAASSAANISFLPEGTITSTNVQAAIAELDSETQTSLAGKAPTSAGTAVGTSVTPTGTIAATNVQAALAELDGDIQAIGTPTASTVTFTPTGTISATNVQSAIAEAASEAVQKSGSTMTGALLNPQYQVGASGDPTKNFTMAVPAAPDGTMKLARGNAGATTQDIMTVDAAGKVAFPQGPVQTGPAFSATGGGGGMVTNALAKVVNINVEQFDTNNCYANSRFTPNVAGYYQITGGLDGDTLGSNYVFPKIYKNGADYNAAGSGALAGSANYWAANVSALVYLNGTTDYVELWASVIGTPSQSESYFSGALVRAA